MANFTNKYFEKNDTFQLMIHPAQNMLISKNTKNPII